MQKNELTDLALDAAQTAGKAAKYCAFVSARKLSILREQERIRTLYAKLGKVCYKDHMLDEEPDEAEYLPLFDDISAAYRRIAELRASLEEARREYRGESEEVQDEA